MRIAYLNVSGVMGGAETSLLELLSSIRREHPSWALHLVLGGDGALAYKARTLNIPVSVLPLPAGIAGLGDSQLSGVRAIGSAVRYGSSLLTGSVASLVYAQELRRLLTSLKPDIIHATGLKMQILASWAKPSPTRLIWHIHDYVGARSIMRLLMRHHSGSVDRVIVNSLDVAQDFRRSCRFSGPVCTIYNAVDVDRYQPTGAGLDLDRLSGLPPADPGTIRVGLVGTFARWKGHLVFLRALARIIPSTRIRGYIVGAPIYATAGSQFTYEDLGAECARLGIQEHVGFTGFVEDTAPVMRTLDIVAHCSTRPEPFGMVIVEAMACGTPVVVSRAGGALELIEEGKTALSHAPADVGELAAQIIRLVEDPILRERLASAGRACVRDRFHRSRLAAELTRIYEACDPCGTDRDSAAATA